MSSKRWVHQTQFHEDPSGGDCTETALACLLGISREEVPDFPKGENAEQARAMEDFVNSLGFELLRSYPDPNRGRGARIYEGYYLASGITERYEGKVKHMVVMKDGKLHHDPHPDGSGLVEIQASYALVPFDPAEFTRKTIDLPLKLEFCVVCQEHSWMRASKCPKCAARPKPKLPTTSIAEDLASGPKPQRECPFEALAKKTNGS